MLTLTGPTRLVASPSRSRFASNSHGVVNRREWLRIGAVGLGGLSLATLLQRQTNGATLASARNVIVLFNAGGMPQHETFDPKPEAPVEYRGPFGAIATRTPGLMFSELLPKTAMISDRMSVIRSMVTGDHAHSTSGYQMLTGVPHSPLSRENAPPGRPNDWPTMASIVNALCPSSGGLPATIGLPRNLANNGGKDPWPGTGAGVLGRRHEPWYLEGDPSSKDFAVPGTELLDGLTMNRIDSRLSLLNKLDSQLDRLERNAEFVGYDHSMTQALSLLAGGKARSAFDLSQEKQTTREQYGLTKYGQSVLLARRLIEAGVRLVQVTPIAEDATKPNGGGWDVHEKCAESCRGWLMPVLDQAYSALILDLEERGLLDETLVCLVSEFGHTPKINPAGGRDHWGSVFSIALAGGGVRGGIVIGRSDRIGAEPVESPIKPCDYLATVFHCLGFSPETTLNDMEGRPFQISKGEVIRSVL